MAVPKPEDLFNPLLAALHDLGSSASIPELEQKVASLRGLSDAEFAAIHRGNRTQLSYNLAWARMYLKKFGLLENSARGVWSLSPLGQQTREVDRQRVVRFVVQQGRAAREAAG